MHTAQFKTRARNQRFSCIQLKKEHVQEISDSRAHSSKQNTRVSAKLGNSTDVVTPRWTRHRELYSNLVLLLWAELRFSQVGSAAAAGNYPWSQINFRAEVSIFFEIQLWYLCSAFSPGFQSDEALLGFCSKLSQNRTWNSRKKNSNF